MPAFPSARGENFLALCAFPHRGNLILMDDGLLAPIDLRVKPLSGSLLDTVTQLCSTH